MRPDAGAVDPATLREASAALDVQLAPAQVQRLVQFTSLLARWNAVYNLTSIEAGDVLTHHLLDSLAVVPHLAGAIAGTDARVLDVGSGGGFPGIPLAIARPAAHFTLLDSVAKKTAFLQQVRVELELANVDVVHARVEKFRAAAFDVIVSRAFAELADMVRLTVHLLAPGGRWLAMKGAYPADEIARLPGSVEAVQTVKLRVPLLGAERHLVVLRSAGPARS